MIDLKCLDREVLAAAIEACKLTKVEICRRARIDRMTLHLYINNKTSMSADNLLAVWEVLDSQSNP